MFKICSKTSRSLINYHHQYAPFLLNFSPYVSSSVESFHTSAVATSKCGDNTCLPKLPVPDLMKTFYKYMKSVKPLVTEQEYSKHCETMMKFVSEKGDGPKLQKLLQARAKKLDNWLEEWWLNTAYLGFRESVCIHSSPGLLMPFQKFSCKAEQLKYSAKLILCAFNYIAQINCNQLKQECAGGKPLDMGQYTKIFGTARIPGKKLDRLQFNPCTTHIIVVHNNHFFRLDLRVNGEMLSYEQIVELLETIVNNSQCRADPMGLLSSDHRDKWGVAYEKLLKDGCNKLAVETIQKAAFVLCLDKTTKCDEDRLTQGGLQLLHGCGTAHNAGNRWYDKTVNFVVSEDGIVGMLYEHSPAEGQPIAVMADYITNCVCNFDPCCLEPACGIKCPEKLTFNMNKDIVDAMDSAVKNMDGLVDNFQLFSFIFDKYGKEFLKCQKLSPDSFIQMMFQLAFYRMHKVPGCCYESGATRLFLGGRTETIRSCSIESMHFVRTFMDACASVEDKMKALCQAIQAHKKYAIEAVLGQGVDRHLLGLRLIAKENKMPEPALFSDVGFKKSTHFRMSTSQVATKCYGVMSYGPTCEDGYSLCYNPRADDIFFSIGAFKSCKETNPKALAEHLVKSFIEVQELMIKYQHCKM